MYEARDGEDVLSSSKKISVKVSTVTKQHAWKTPTPACVGWIKDQDRAGRTATAYRQDGQLVGCIKALVVLSQIQAVAGQPTYCLSQYEWVCIVLLGRNRHWCADMGNLATGKTVHHFCFGLWYGQSSQKLKKRAMRWKCTSKISRSPYNWVTAQSAANADQSSGSPAARASGRPADTSGSPAVS